MPYIQTCMLDSFWHQGLGLGERALDVLRSFGLAKELEAVSLPMGTEINLLANPSGPPLELHRDELYQHRRSDPALGFLAELTGIMESLYESDWGIPSHCSTSRSLKAACAGGIRPAVCSSAPWQSLKLTEYSSLQQGRNLTVESIVLWKVC